MALPPESAVQVELADTPAPETTVLDGVAADTATIATIEAQLHADGDASAADRETILHEAQARTDELRAVHDALHRAEIDTIQYLHSDAGDGATVADDGPGDHAG